ncbi:MAG: serine/threonine-protein kinase, partial [archaeon]|nr:serine/threonine-protein kinase [archaeon]
METPSSSKQKSARSRYPDLENYTLEATIGKGAFSIVKLGYSIKDNLPYAIKIINKLKMPSSDFKRTLREIEILKNLPPHDNIIKIVETFENDEEFYIIMEYCTKGELFNYICREKRLTEEESAFFFYQLVNAVDFIHQNKISHRDLKPENILLTPKRNIKIIDFGLSNYFDHTELLKTACGSPCYASPEMIKGGEYNAKEVDIWNIGIILYIMLCGSLPFHDKNNYQLFQKILRQHIPYPDYLSKKSKDIIGKLLVKDYKKRITLNEIKKTEFYILGKNIFNIKYNFTYEKLAIGKKDFFDSSETVILTNNFSNNNGPMNESVNSPVISPLLSPVLSPVTSPLQSPKYYSPINEFMNTNGLSTPPSGLKTEKKQTMQQYFAKQNSIKSNNSGKKLNEPKTEEKKETTHNLDKINEDQIENKKEEEIKVNKEIPKKESKKVIKTNIKQVREESKPKEKETKKEIQMPIKKANKFTLEKSTFSSSSKEKKPKITTAYAEFNKNKKEIQKKRKIMKLNDDSKQNEDQIIVPEKEKYIFKRHKKRKKDSKIADSQINNLIDKKDSTLINATFGSNNDSSINNTSYGIADKIKKYKALINSSTSKTNVNRSMDEVNTMKNIYSDNEEKEKENIKMTERRKPAIEEKKQIEVEEKKEEIEEKEEKKEIPLRVKRKNEK